MEVTVPQSSATTTQSSATKAERSVTTNTPFDALFPDGFSVEKVATGATWSEGPLWVPTAGEAGALRWSDIPGNRILQYDPTTGQTTEHRTGVEFTNGRTLASDGSVVQCSHGRRAVEVEAADGSLRTLVDAYAGVRLNSPNDVVIASDGAIWFTDPPYGITQPTEGYPGVREYGDCYVFRFDPADGSITPVVIDVEEPNGLAFSPDESVLYVADTSWVSHADGGGNRHVRAYDVQVDDLGVRCKNGRVLVAIDNGVVDGFRVDERGRLWLSSEDAVIVVDDSGAELGRIPVPERIGNLCFGGEDGRDLYIAASTSIYRVRTTERDAARRAAS